MPRVEDIAWKFVIRQGKKWRCPYCKNEYSGSVTRVKSHFRKQPKEGIAACTKVPEHISTLMELLQNQVHNKDDIAWKFVDRLEENKWRCHQCREEFCGDVTGVKGHLLGVPNERISICMEVPDHVRTLMRSSLDEVAEEESRGTNGQSSTEPQSRHMPAQADVAEEESRDANSQFFPEPQRPLLSPEIFSPNSLEQWVQSMTMTDIGVNSDQRSQPEREFHQSSTMPSQVQNSHGMSM
ncbi:hypothetical protein EUGRSUZ_L01859 [Eucalyptus grandis]|nr:hypothetical protein EUGRSUZ_L01859 [Eucalyptus grandis]KAK2632211.1 hypothetical protein EUGRSUZ_L01859 [Eucalyptus grandis]